MLSVHNKCFNFNQQILKNHCDSDLFFDVFTAPPNFIIIIIFAVFKPVSFCTLAMKGLHVYIKKRRKHSDHPALEFQNEASGHSYIDFIYTRLCRFQTLYSVIINFKVFLHVENFLRSPNSCCKTRREYARSIQADTTALSTANKFRGEVWEITMCKRNFFGASPATLRVS